MNRNQKIKILLTDDEAHFVHDLIIRNNSAIAHTIRHKLGSYHSYLFQDCLSETYLVACENIAVLKSHENPDGWIVKTAKITALRLIQENSKHSSNLPIEEALLMDDSKDTLEDALYSMWIENGVPEKLIKQLTKREQQIYEMLYIKQKSPKEISEELGISTYTVWTINHSIKKKIKYAIDKKLF